MKKGESIRLEIRSADDKGLLLYSYKKKAEIFIDKSQLKAGYSKEKYQQKIGSPIILRLVSTRPQIIMSEKFIHNDAPLFDDYSLKHKESDSKTDKEKNIAKESVVLKKMIDNKKIIITKENQFDKGWTLFQPYNIGISDNRAFRETLMSDVVRQITHSTKVNIILCGTCLSSRVIKEIEWANQYIELNIIAKDESIIKRYSSFKFTSISIDNSIDFNYIGVVGKEFGYYMISDGYVKINDSVDKVYFQRQPCKKDYSFLKSVDSVIIVDKDGEKDYSELIKETKKVGTECYYAVNTACYNRKHFDFAKKESLTLLVSNQTINGVILIHKDRTLSCLVIGAKNFFIIYPIAKTSVLIGQEFKCGFYNDTVDTKSLNGDIYSCYNGKLSKLNIVTKKTIEIEVPIKEMADFVMEKFDSSITNEHNNYSAEAIKVEYRFSLIPPLFDNTFMESDIYKPMHDLANQWRRLQTLDIDEIKASYNSIIEEDFGIVDFLENSISFTYTLIKAVKSCSYVGYYTWLNAATDLYSYYDKKLIEVCKQIFNAINKESSGTKFNKFDDEIAGYEQTIKDKTALIKKGEDVLSNKRRVEILTKKITDLQALKQRFENTTDTRNDKTLYSFIAHCNELLLNNHKVEINDSIGTIVKPKEETKTARLYAFVDTFLYLIKKYIGDCLIVLGKLKAVHIPEDYPVFDKNGERFIIINELEEFLKTKPLCDEFKLKCIARR